MGFTYSAAKIKPRRTDNVDCLRHGHRKRTSSSERAVIRAASDRIGHRRPYPQISWRFLSSTTTVLSWEQLSYDIQISYRPNSAEIESHRVASPDSVLVPWPNRPLNSRQRARVRVRAYGRIDGEQEEPLHNPTEWAPWATVECGLLDREDWIARPITNATATAAAEAGGQLDSTGRPAKRPARL
ncbi:hypothetical protein BJY01DRAFT_249730 [Aspergillus pseudoustus]|uniref:Uncharacterized protein n=1 Tax=Aspergillus pseudoustus TaxID=1810923 RepID=A0ABR4JLW1_9EURO